MEKSDTKTFTEWINDFIIGKVDPGAVARMTLGGAAVAGGSSLLAALARDIIDDHKDRKATDDKNIEINIPRKAASAKDSFDSARAGETVLTARGGRQLRAGGRFSSTVSPKRRDPERVEKDAAKMTPPTLALGTAGALGGGMLAYEAVSRIMSELRVRRLERELAQAEKAYNAAMNGLGKSAEYVSSLFSASERYVAGLKSVKEAADKAEPSVWDALPGIVRYAPASYWLSLLLAGGSAAYLTKKTMDKAFPSESLGTNYNMPARIVLRTTPGKRDSARLVEKDRDGNEKEASDTVKMAMAFALPVYMDVVEGAPNRVMTEPYVKYAEAIGTTPDGLMKLAAGEGQPPGLLGTILQYPGAMWAILRHAWNNFSPQSLRNAWSQAWNANSWKGGVKNFAQGIAGNKYDLYNAVRAYDPNVAEKMVHGYINDKMGDGFTARLGRKMVNLFGADKAVQWHRGFTAQEAAKPQSFRSLSDNPHGA